MIKKYFALVCFICFGSSLQSASVSVILYEFESLPPAASISGGGTFCQYSAVLPEITFTGSGGTAPYTFTYRINSGALQTITSTGDTATLQVPVNNSGNFEYYLVSVEDADEENEEISGQSVTVTLNPGPDASLGGTGLGKFNGADVFKVCDNATSTFTFTNISATIVSLNSNYTIDWGDNSSLYETTSWTTLTHDYEPGVYDLIYTIEGNNGCTTVKEYIVFVGSNPAVSLGNPGNTDICIVESITFPITGTENNSKGTLYTITFNDGSPPQVFSHPPPSEISHTFLKSSCNTTSSSGNSAFSNSFSANILASNPCGSSAVGVVPIYVSASPSAEFDYPEDPVCTNTEVCFISKAEGSVTNGTDPSCTDPRILWEITPNTYTINNGGVLGNDFGQTDSNLWQSGSNNLCLEFTEPGTYTITQKVGNKCGIDLIQQTICVEKIEPQFTLNTTDSCTPSSITTTNTTDESNTCNPPEYLWSVQYESDFCGTGVEEWEFENGSTPTSVAPQFNFIAPGTYTITLRAEISCGAVETVTEEVVVKQPPIISINAIGELCDTNTINPSAQINSCSDTPSSLLYNWQFPGATPASSALENPGVITYAGPGEYTFSLEVTNDCGKSTLSNETFRILEVPVVTNTNLTQEICSGTQTTATVLSSNVDGATFTWSAVATPGITGFVSSGISATIPSELVSTSNSVAGTLTYTVTPYNNNCQGTSKDFIVTVNPAPEITEQPQSSTVCINGTATTLRFASSDSSVQYNWYSNSVNSTLGATLISGETNASFDPPTDSIGELYYYAEMIFTSGGCSSINSQIASVNVTPVATISTQPLASQSLCVGGSLVNPLSIAHGNGVGTVSYQWYSNTTSSNTGGTIIVGAEDETYNPPVFTDDGEYYYYVEVGFTGSGCTLLKSNPAEVLVVDPPSIDTQPVASQTVCENSKTESLSVQASGGVEKILYQWFVNLTDSNLGGTPIAGETNSTFTPPSDTVGTFYYYCVISQDANESCTDSSDTSEVNVNLAPKITLQPQAQEICFGDNVNDLIVGYSNGVGTPSYQWYVLDDTGTETAINGENSDTFTPPVNEVGVNTYYVTLTFSSGGCTEILSDRIEIRVNETPAISDFSEIICSGSSFTIVPDTANGDVVPSNITYIWDAPIILPANSIIGASAVTTPQNNMSQTLTNTSTVPATATYTVRPSAGICEGDSFTVEITVNPALTVNETVVSLACFGVNTGSISTNISGGQPFISGTPYVLSWEGPMGFTSTETAITNLNPGDYTLSVQDQLGCVLAETYTIRRPELLTLTVDIENSISCNGENDGEIAVTINGGTPSYSFEWTRNGSFFSDQEDITNLLPGIYELTVTDANSCEPIVQSFLIEEPDELIVSLESQTNVTCFGDATGAILINVTGGTPIETTPGVFGYSYFWKGPNDFSSTSKNVSNLLAGTYTLLITDANGCEESLSAIITQPDEILISYEVSDVQCYGGNDGSITITDIVGGSGSYAIQWSNFGKGRLQSNLSAGDYTISVTDTFNCTVATTVTINEPPVFAISPMVQQISCFGERDGRIVLNFEGGQAPIDFAWDDDPSAGIERNNLGPGTYTIFIEDAVPCVITETFTIQEPLELSVSANITNALDCEDPNSGAINLLINGGTGPFSVSWSNGSSREDLAGVPSGNYVVSVTDANGCKVTDSYRISRPTELGVTVATTTNVDCNTFYADQSFSAEVFGGVPPYSLEWSSGAISGTNNEVMNTDQNGLVILEVTDTLGCVTNYTFQVAIPVLSDAEFSTTSKAFESFGVYSQIDPIQFTNTTTGSFESVSWDFGDGSISFEENPIHTYASPGVYVVVQSVSFPGGCLYTKTISLSIEKGYELVTPTAFTPNNDGLNDFFKPVSLGLEAMEFRVYNTWGNLVYSEFGDTLRGWDGKIKGELLENGNYYYTFSGKTVFGKTISKSGSILVIL